MKIGVFAGMSAEEYFAHPAVNKSSLDDFAQSPLHYFARHLDPAREARAVSDAMTLGSAVHTAILEPDLFRDRYVLEPIPADFPGCLASHEDLKEACRKADLKVSGTKAELKARLVGAVSIGAIENPVFFDDIESAIQNSGKEILSAKRWTQARNIAAALRSHSNYELFLTGGQAELTVISKHEKTGLFRKARIDYLAQGGEVLVDLKKVRDASPKGWERAVGEYNYHRQAAGYMDTAIAGGLTPKLFAFVAIEEDPPYAAAFYYATPEMLEQGREENENLLAGFASCLERNKWPGYSEEILPCNLPPWRRDKTTTSEETPRGAYELETF